MIDFIGGTHIALRRSADDGVTLRLLKREDQLQVVLDGEEWMELAGLIVAVIAARDFWDPA